MADLTTTAALGRPITTAYGSLVVTGDGDTVTALEFQRLYDAAPAGSKPTIDRILTGAYEGTVQLDDGSRVSLGEYQRRVLAAAAGAEPDIVTDFGPGYAATAIGANGEDQNLTELYIK